ncbi:MAG TPA: cbb3-type cytochrome c oxidase subunit I [Burkholderiales bacterium]|nr:cbb3-type cytochrome c oxidase subunit I [Burkholderiales bacterium]
MSALHPDNEALPRGERIVLNLYVVSSLVVFLLMMLLGLCMRMAQGAWISLGPDRFYQVMTAHGAGMVGVAGLASSAVMWFFLRKYVRLRLSMFAANYVLFVLGAVAILAATFLGGYAGAWTFLYPLPVHSMNLWSVNAAALFMLGYLLIGVGFLLFYLDAMLAVIRVYGNLGRALGLQWLFAGEIERSHPPAVVASTMVIITNSLGILAGAVVLVMCLINAYYPSVALNALLVKNLIFFFGHVFINATIYMSVIVVYELLPRYTGRAWGLSRAFLWGWAASTVMVLIVYPHHLLMDYVMPHWMLVMGQIISYTSGLPVFVVTAYGALANIHRSGIRWSMPAKLIMLSMFGWAAGIVPAIIDGTIRVNLVMHNTQWVPGHFHFYLLLGVLPMALAFMYHLAGSRANDRENAADRLGFPVYLVGGLGFVLAFLAAGHASVPRRFAVHLPEWLPYDRAGSVGAILVVAAMLAFTVRIVAGLLGSTGHGAPAHSVR